MTLAFVVAVVIIVSAIGEDLFYGFPPVVTAALMLPILASLLTAGVAFQVARIQYG